MIQIQNLNKTYKSIQALKDVNLQVNKGELFAFLGPNGAGKTTTIRILTGLTKRTSGTGLMWEIQGLKAAGSVGWCPSP